jgi:hypothetical protein
VHYKAIGAGNRRDTLKVHIDVARLRIPRSWKVPNESERDRVICDVGGIGDLPCVIRCAHAWVPTGGGEKNENVGWE